MKNKILATKTESIPRDIQVILSSGDYFDKVTQKINGVSLQDLGVKFIPKPVNMDDVISSLPKNANVYFLDDDDSIRDLITKFLRRSHFNVISFINPEEMIAYLKVNPILDNAVILTDNSMGSNISGIQLVQAIRKGVKW